MNETKRELRVMAFLWALFFSVTSLLTALRTALAHVEWSTLSPQGKLETSADVVILWGTVMGAFISKSVARLKQGKDIVTNGTDTEQFTKPGK